MVKSYYAKRFLWGLSWEMGMATIQTLYENYKIKITINKQTNTQKPGPTPESGGFIPFGPNRSCHFLRAVQSHWPPARGLGERPYVLLISLSQTEL